MSARIDAYQDYINSDDWAERRAQYFASHPRKCSACKTKKLIHLHHRTYERFTHELDDDLMALCMKCHKQVHDLHNLDRSRNLAAVTDLVVQQIKAARKPPNKKRTPEQRAIRARNREIVCRAEFQERMKGVVISVGTPGSKPTVGKVGRSNQHSGGSGKRKKNTQAARLVAIEQFKKSQGFGYQPQHVVVRQSI